MKIATKYICKKYIPVLIFLKLRLNESEITPGFIDNAKQNIKAEHTGNNNAVNESLFTMAVTIKTAAAIMTEKIGFVILPE